MACGLAFLAVGVRADEAALRLPGAEDSEARAAPRPAASPTAELTKAAELVEQLGSERFHLREEARRRLSAAGLAARDALNAGLESDDLEVRLQCHRLLIELADSRRQREIDRLLYQYQPDQAYQLPGWRVFRSVAGDDADARGLYVLILRNHAARFQWLDQTLQADAPTAPDVDQLTEFLSPDTERLRSGDPAYWSVLLLVGSQAREARFNVLDGRLFAGLLDETTAARLDATVHREPLRRVLAAWLDALPADQSVRSRLRVCLRFELTDAGERLARDVLDGDSSPSAVQAALFGVLRWIPAEAPERLIGALEDDRLCHTWQIVGEERRIVRTRVSDTALALLLWHAEIDPREVGFADVQADPLTIYRDYSTGFPDDTRRRAAYAAARKRLAESHPEWAAQLPIE